MCGGGFFFVVLNLCFCFFVFFRKKINKTQHVSFQGLKLLFNLEEREMRDLSSDFTFLNA